MVTEKLCFKEANDVDTTKGSWVLNSEKYFFSISGSKKDFVAPVSISNIKRGWLIVVYGSYLLSKEVLNSITSGIELASNWKTSASSNVE